MSNSTIIQIATVFPGNTDLKLHRRRSIVREFSLNTSTHGIPGIARSQSIPNRIFWTITLLCFTGIMIYFITESIRVYFTYPTQTLYKFDSEWPQEFPAVTICNYSPFRYDLLIDSFLNFTKSKDLPIVNNKSEFKQIHANYIRDFMQYIINNNQSIEKYFFSLENMLISCEYNGLNCIVDDFTPFISSVYGNCYTLNAQNNRIRNGTLFLNTDNGGTGILNLQLYIHSHQYVPYFSDAVGVMAMIHDSRDIPLIDYSGVYLYPGFKHRITTIKKRMTNLRAPYSTCTDRNPPMVEASFAYFGGTDYSFNSGWCSTVCTQVFVYSRCGCINPYQWSARSIVLPGTTEIIHAPLCNITDPCYIESGKEFQISNTVWTDFCSQCPDPCSRITYTQQLSALSAPVLWTYDNIKTFVESSSVELPTNWNSSWSSEIQKNYIGLEIVSEIAAVDNYTTVASISWIDVISNVGGHTGLWIGISFLSIMEFIEMFYRLIRHHFHLLRIRFQ